MLFKNLVTRALPGLLLVTSLANAQSEEAATIPASFHGTYALTFTSFNSESPIASDTAFTLVLRADNSLCVNDTVLTAPVLRNGNPAEAIWTDSDASLEYAISNLTSSFNEVNVLGLQGSPFYGQMNGEKVSDDTSCSSSSSPEVTSSMESIFSLAESKLSEFFPSGAVTQFFENYVYRYYESTGIYLAFAEGNVFLLGGAFGEAILDAGAISSVLSTLEVYQPIAVDSGDLWNLEISGTFSTSMVPNVAFDGITLEGVPAPDLGNNDEISQEIISSLDGIASGIGSISITVIANTENQRTFDVSFSATVPSLGAVTYDLRYRYTR